MYSPLLSQLIDAFTCLPGVGIKTAQRMAFHLLQRDRKNAITLANHLIVACEKIHHCKICRNYCETEICMLCNNPARDEHLLCIVESPVDVVAIEQSTPFNGKYFVLMGHLSPIDGIGPNEIGIPLLEQLLKQRTLSEIILATNPTVEGEATAHFIQQMAKQQHIKTTRIAHAFSGRRNYDH